MFSLDIFCELQAEEASKKRKQKLCERYFHYERMSNFVGCERINKLPYAIIYNSFRRRRLPIAFFSSVCYIIQKELRKKNRCDRPKHIHFACALSTNDWQRNEHYTVNDRQTGPEDMMSRGVWRLAEAILPTGKSVRGSNYGYANVCFAPLWRADCVQLSLNSLWVAFNKLQWQRMVNKLFECCFLFSK